MAKRKITVTVDEEIIAQAQLLGAQSLSSVVNDALAVHVERLARHRALGALLDSWDSAFGPPSEADAAAARTAFEELDGLAEDRGVA